VSSIRTTPSVVHVTPCWNGRKSLSAQYSNTCSWTENAILALIILYAVILAIQSSVPLYTPRPGDGYFQTWEDAVILVLFCIFSYVIAVMLSQY
jgi:hypothetical protein